MKNSLSRRLFQKYGLPPRGYQWGATSFLPTQGMWSVWRCCVESKAGVLISVSVGISQPHFVGSIEPIIVGNVRANGLKYKMPTTQICSL